MWVLKGRMAKITLPDGSVLEVADGATFKQVAEQIGPGLAKVALLARADGRLVDLATPVTGDTEVQIVTTRDPEGLDAMRHSCAHVMAEAICRIWPETKLVYGPTVEDGFYYDIDLDEPIRPDDFERIEAEMAQIAKADAPFVRVEMGRDEALAKLTGDKYKTDNIQRVDSEVISFYSQGDGFQDLCRGPHVPSTGKVGAFKVMSVAGAYWHGDATQKMLQRVYGTTWASKKDLDDYLNRLEEAKKRDHRVLGKQLELFSFSEMGPGFAFMHAKGTVIWNEILGFLRAMNRKYGYTEIKTPIILNEELWHRSGHWDNYKENMYFCEIDKVGYAVKPMNCPGGCLVYKTTKHSYREFPMRVAEFGMVHRHEASGVMHGLFRVRQFTQDDAHIFCLPDQIEAEIVGTINLIFETYRAFGFEGFMIELSTKPEKHIGSDEIWDIADQCVEGGPGAQGDRLQDQRGGWGVLRAQDRFPYPRQPEAVVADGDDPVGFLDAAAVRAGLYGRGQYREGSGNDPPGGAGVVRAVFGDSDRALRRGDARVAVAGAGEGAADQREDQRVRAGRAAAAVRGRRAGGGGSVRRENRGQNCQNPRRESPVHAGGGTEGSRVRRRERAGSRRSEVSDDACRRVFGESHPENRR